MGSSILILLFNKHLSKVLYLSSQLSKKKAHLRLSLHFALQLLAATIALIIRIRVSDCRAVWKSGRHNNRDVYRGKRQHHVIITSTFPTFLMQSPINLPLLLFSKAGWSKSGFVFRGLLAIIFSSNAKQYLQNHWGKADHNCKLSIVTLEMNYMKTTKQFLLHFVILYFFIYFKVLKQESIEKYMNMSGNEHFS